MKREEVEERKWGGEEKEGGERRKNSGYVVIVSVRLTYIII